MLFSDHVEVAEIAGVDFQVTDFSGDVSGEEKKCVVLGREEDVMLEWDQWNFDDSFSREYFVFPVLYFNGCVCAFVPEGSFVITVVNIKVFIDWFECT